jgi:signal transduction histidine kinase/CHASE3 domain sensor protein
MALQLPSIGTQEIAKAASGDLFQRIVMRLPKTIGLKIKFTQALILAVCVAALVATYLGVSKARQSIRHMMEVHDPLNTALSEMQLNILERSSDVLRYLATGNPQLRDEMRARSENFGRLKAQYDQLVPVEEVAKQLKTLGNRLAVMHAEYKETGDRVMDAQDAGRLILAQVRMHVSTTEALVDQWTEAEGNPASARAHVLRDLKRECATTLALVSIYKHDHAGEFARALSSVVQELRDSYRRLQELAQTPADRRRLQEISDPLVNGAAAVARLGALCAGMRADTNRLFDLRVELDHLLHGEIQGIIEQDMDEDNVATSQATGRVLWLLALLIPALLVSSGMLGRKLLRGITDPLKVLAEGTAAIGRGDTSRRIILEEPEEFANVARQFNKMAADLQSTMVSKAALEVKEETLLNTYRALQREMDQRNSLATALQESREKIRKAAEEWQQMFDCIESPFLVLNANGHCHRANRAALKLCGGEFTPGGPKCEPTKLCPLADSFGSIISLLRRGNNPAAIQKKDEAGRNWQLDGVRIWDSEGEERFIILVRDLTPLVVMQESLNRSERMSAMGALVSAVAHEVRNPLFILTATLEVLDATHVVGPEAKEYFETVRQQVGRLDALMRDLLEYGKPSPMKLWPGNIGSVIDQAITECRPLADQLRVRIDNGVDYQLPSIPMDASRLAQVFRNIIENAVQHSPEQGTVRIHGRPFQREGEWVECCITDQGRGFRTEDFDKLFQPFFTRRAGGTGLGLAISQRIVEAHAGLLSVSNALEGGAVVRICFPLAGPKTQQEEEDSNVKTENLAG